MSDDAALGPGYGMRCRILSDNPIYVHGWEMGMLWCRLAGLRVQEPPKEQHIEVTIHSVNDEQAVVMAGVSGWNVVSIRRMNTGADDVTEDDTVWSEIVLERKESTT